MSTNPQSSVRRAPLAEKLSPSTMGKATMVDSNMTILTIPDKLPVFLYDIRIYGRYKREGKADVEKEFTKQTRDDFPQQERHEICDKIYRSLLRDQKEFFGNSTFYDRGALLYSLSKLKSSEKEFVLPGKYADAVVEAESIRVSIKPSSETFQMCTSDIMKKVGILNVEEGKPLINWINTVLNESSYDHNVHIYKNRHFLNEKDNEKIEANLPILKGGKVAQIGLEKTAHIVEGKREKNIMVIETNVSKAAFHKSGQSLIDKIGEMSIMNGRFDVNLAIKHKDQIETEITGLYVISKLGRGTRSLKVEGLYGSANTVNFEYEGKAITVTQYHRKKYGLNLQHPSLFLVKSKNSFYPVETLIVGKHQKSTEQQKTAEEREALLKAATSKPTVRERESKLMENAIGIREGSALKKAGIKVDQKNLEVPAKELPALSKVYGGRKDDVWQNGGKMWRGGECQTWMVATLLTHSSQHFASESGQYIDQLISRAVQRGMKLCRPQKIANLADQEETIRQFVEEAKKMECTYLLFISDKKVKKHELIKLLELEASIVTQEIVVSNARADKIQTMDNIINKMNMKLNGINYKIEPPTKVDQRVFQELDNSINNNRRLIIGFEFCLSQNRSTAGKPATSPSILAWGANTGSDQQIYVGDYLYAEPNQSVIAALELNLPQLMCNIIKDYAKAPGRAVPRSIIIYINGISEGQYDNIPNEIFDAIKKGGTMANEKFNLTGFTTILAVSKHHGARFYQQNINDQMPAAKQNLRPTTVIDTHVVSPFRSEFYLAAHTALQGTARSIKVTTAVNTLKMSMETQEYITHALCNLHQISNGPISLPEPLKMAENCAKRGRANFMQLRKQIKLLREDGTLDVDLLNTQYRVTDLVGIPYNK